MTTAALATKMVKVASSLGWQKKRGDGPGYKFVQATDIFADVRTLLQEQNIAFAWSTTDFLSGTIPRDGKTPQYTAEIAGDYSFIDGDSGDVITGRFVGFGIDTAGKALWAAQTGALKYIFITNFLLPTGDDPEATESGHDDAKPAARQSGPTPPAADAVGLTRDQVKLFMARLNDAGLKSVGQKKALTTLVVSKHSTKQMTSADLDKVLEELKDPDSEALANALAVA